MFSLKATSLSHPLTLTDVPLSPPLLLHLCYYYDPHDTYRCRFALFIAFVYLSSLWMHFYGCITMYILCFYPWGGL